MEGESKNPKEYFLSLLPTLPDNFMGKIEDPDFKALDPDIRLPFHVTLYYLGRLSPDDLKSTIKWLKQKQAIQSPIKAKVKSVSSFKRNGESTAYFFDLDSREIEALNKELFEKFSHLRKDEFGFEPHMTLFYPTKKITKSQREKLSSLFSDISEMHFGQLALGSVVGKKIEINQLVT